MTEIAISTEWHDGGEYAQAVTEAGARVRLLDFGRPLLEQLAGVDGVVLSGGGDVDPILYGGDAASAHEVDARRDRFELDLVHVARERELPTLCICRGVQLANVAFGGTLVEDIGSALGAPAAALHRRIGEDGEADRGLIDGHAVELIPDSLLATVVATRPLVTGSRHHQAVRRVADALRIVGSTPDGIVEALEARFDSPFWLGVQWHPESTRDADGGASRAIFAAFVAAAARAGLVAGLARRG